MTCVRQGSFTDIRFTHESNAASEITVQRLLFGNCLFAAIPATKQDVVTLAKNVFPFVIILFATVFLVSYVPVFSTFLPNLMKG